MIHAIILIIVGILIWKYVPGLIKNKTLGTIAYWAGIVIGVLGVIDLIRALAI